MTLYPKAIPVRDAKWGSQRLDPGYTPVPLDSEVAAVARALAALEAGKSRDEARAVGLAGSDEVRTMDILLDEIEAEVVACRSVSPADHATVDSYTEALPVRYLDPAKWYAGLKAEYDVSTYADLRIACAPAVVEK